MLYALGLIAILIAALTAAIWLAPAQTLAALQNAARSRAGLERKEIVVDGVRVVYLEGGSGEPLLLMHGFGGEKDSFVRVARYLTPHYRVILPDVPGFGESDKRTDIGYSVDEIVERMHRFAAALGAQKLSIGGNSMGGLLAAAYTAKHPGEVKTLWMLSAGPKNGVPKSDLTLALEAQGGSLAPKTVEDFEQMLQYVVAKPPPMPRPLLQLLAARALANQALQQRILEQIMASPPIEARVPGMPTPTLITWGEHDRVAHPAGAQALHQLLPRSVVRMIPGTGHLPMTEDAKTAAADYLTFRAALP